MKTKMPKFLAEKRVLSSSLPESYCNTRPYVIMLAFNLTVQKTDRMVYKSKSKLELADKRVEYFLKLLCDEFRP